MVIAAIDLNARMILPNVGALLAAPMLAAWLSLKTAVKPLKML